MPQPFPQVTPKLPKGALARRLPIISCIRLRQPLFYLFARGMDSPKLDDADIRHRCERCGVRQLNTETDGTCYFI